MMAPWSEVSIQFFSHTLPNGSPFLEHIPEALDTNCAKCSEKQKSNSIKIGKYIYANEPQYAEELKGKYDPDGKYFQQFEGALKAGLI